MNLLEFLDNWGKRRHTRYMARPSRPLDTTSFIGLGFLAGYYVMVYTFIHRVVPAANIPLVRDAMLVLGPGVGLIIGALFRTNVRDQIATENVGKQAEAFGKQAEATTAAAQAGTNQSEGLGGGDTLKSGDSVTVKKQEDPNPEEGK